MRSLKMNKTNHLTLRTAKDYLQLPYTIQIQHDTSVDPSGWVARVAELPGCITQADTLEELGSMIEEAILLWIETELEDGAAIPLPRNLDDFSGRFLLRLPRSLHRDLVLTAEREGVSLNALVNSILNREIGRREIEPS